MSYKKVTTLNNIAPSCIGNMDETAIWYDMPGATTIAVKGTNSAPLLMKSSALLCALQL